eukprot:6814091-Pyramimonas_sp.AAC.1
MAGGSALMAHSHCASGSSPVLRNRPKTYPWKWRSLPIQNQMTNPRSLQVTHPEAPGTVSYTHLTLPTILLV